MRKARYQSFGSSKDIPNTIEVTNVDHQPKPRRIIGSTFDIEKARLMVKLGQYKSSKKTLRFRLKDRLIDQDLNLKTLKQ